ncbi:DnaD domain-containing protein [Oceanobacillus sp. Castelsardo]|uniref:DnaD domain-containing protein n=1 Tax=Oceanobacillus sp. Castelsardo TaxID=1851204 RepID=UPI0018D40234|nr:DnaD domain protein [Oceanobacillus sp. Castelsardo]
MNYIRELNAFYDSMEYNPLTSSAITLWYALMHINNKTRWKNEFRVAGTVLRFKSGLTESSFKRARTELKEKGYIAYEPQSGNQAPIYRMISLIESNNDEQQIDADDISIEAESAGEPTTKQEEGVKGQAEAVGEAGTKQKSEEKDVFQFYRENFSTISPFVTKSLNDWIENVGETLVLEAMKRALERNKTSWVNVKGILLAWEKKGIRNMNAVRADDMEFRNRKKRHYHYIPNGRREVIPDWFKEQEEQKNRLEKKNQSMVVDPEEADAVRMEIQRLKRELGYG